ncbi:MAG: hypothetical protein ABI444_10935 [Candidatus Kapaibacterium sp.]|jgi:hypothetical protein
MKTRIANILSVALVSAICLGGLSQASFGQARPSSKTSDISIGPLSLLVQGVISVQYEWKASQTSSWALRGEFVPTSGNFHAFGVGAAYRFYVADSRAITGLSVAPALDLFFFGSSSLQQNYTILSIGGDIAYKWIFDQFSVEPLVGVRIGVTGGQSVSAFSGFYPLFDCFLGYAF